MNKLLTKLLCFLTLTSTVCLKAQSISEILLPEMATVINIGKSDSIVVVSTAWNNLYYRFKHDSLWHHIATSPFTQIGALSVDGTDIYAFASTNGNAGLSGILKSSDMGVTWTQKITETYIQSHNIYPSYFCSSANACFWVDGYDIKRCNYTGLAISAMTSNALLSVGQLEWINGALYFSNDNNNVTGNIFGGGCFKSTGFTSFGSGVSYFALQKPACYRNQNQVVFFDRLTGILYASNTSGSAYNMFNTSLSNSQYNSVNLYAAYGHFYAIIKSYYSTTIYHIAADVANTSVWNFAGANAVWDVYQLPYYVPDIDAIEIMTDGKLLTKSGTLFLYEPTSHIFKSFSQGIHEARVNDAHINSNNDIIANINDHNYIKYANENNFKYLSRSILVSNYRMTKFSISNSGNIYSLDNPQLVLGRSLDSAHTFTLDYSNQAIMNSFMKNDSILLLKDSTFLVSNNGGNSYYSISSGGINLSMSNTQAYIISSSKNQNSILLAVQDFSQSTFSHFSTNDFGNTWNYIPENQYASFYDYCIDNTAIYSINDPNVNVGYDTIFIHTQTNKIPVNIFTYSASDTIYNRSFWAEDGSLYISCVKQMLGQYFFKIYKALANNAAFSEIYSQQVDGVFMNTKYMFSCAAKKLITGCYNKLYLLDNSYVNQNLITGKVFMDSNNDNIINNNEQLLPGILMHTSNNQYAVSSLNGNYALYPATPNDTLKVIAPIYYTSIPPYHIVNAGDTAKNFSIQAIPNINDLQASVFSMTDFRPGNKNKLFIACKNVGTTTITNAQIKISNSNLDLISTTPSYSTFLNDTITWNIPSITSQQQLNFIVVDSVSVNMPLGSVLLFNSQALPILNDSTPYNNTDTISKIVIGSFDPNDKQVEPKNYTTTNQQNGDYLTYTIRFQNTGTAAALNVVVTDPLNALLDINTLQVLASSHIYSVAVKANNVLEFTFNNINLPDSNTSELLSHGFVSFRIKPKSTWNIGQNIDNTAAIYFDYNSPVITNTVNSVLLATVGLTENNASNLSVYPNPFAVELSIKGAANSMLEIYSADGKIVFRKNIINGLEQINTKSLLNGFYIVKVISANNQNTVFKLSKGL